MQEVKMFIDEAKEILKSKETYYKNEKNRIEQYIINNFISRSDVKNINIQSRVKTVHSIGEKVIRKNGYIEYKDNPNNFVENLKDVIGVRLTCLLDSQEKEVYEQIVKFFDEPAPEQLGSCNSVGFHKILDATFPYLIVKHSNQPEKQKNGRDIFRLECKWIVSDTEFVNFELQIKSLVHMFWGEIEHELMYKNYYFNKDHEYFANTLGNMSDLLHLIDNELNSIQQHLTSLQDTEDISRISDFFTEEMSINIQPKIQEILEVEIDLRNVYIILNNMFINSKSSQEYNDFFGAKILSLKNIHITESDFKIEQSDLLYDPSRETQINRLYELIKKRIMSDDLYWKITYILFKKIDSSDEKDKFKNFVNSLVLYPINKRRVELFTNINDELSALEDDLDDNTISSMADTLYEILDNALLVSYIDFLENNDKVELFLLRKSEYNFSEILYNLLDSFLLNIINIDVTKFESKKDLILEHTLNYFKLVLEIKFNPSSEHVDQYNETLNYFQSGDNWLLPLSEDVHFYLLDVIASLNYDTIVKNDVLDLLSKRGVNAHDED